MATSSRAGLRAQGLRRHGETDHRISQLHDVRWIPTSLWAAAVLRDGTTDAGGPRPGLSRGRLLLDRLRGEAEEVVLAGLGLRRGNKGGLPLEIAMEQQSPLQKVVGQAIPREELEAHPTLTIHAHHLPDHDTTGDGFTPPAGVRLPSHADEGDHDQYQVMIHGGVAEAEDIEEDTGDHPHLHPRTTGAVDVLTLSGIDHDETTPD